MQLYTQRQWQIKEYPFRPDGLAHTETIFTIGNGLVGVRGSFEEGYPGAAPTTLAAGVFNHKAGQLVPELAVLPDWLYLQISINGESFNMTSGRVIGFERILDLKTATLSRGVLWLSPKRTILRLLFERFASLDQPHLMAQRVTIQPLSEGTHEIEITAALDASVTNPFDVNHWGESHAETEGNLLCWEGKTDQSGYHVAMRAALNLEGAAAQWEDVSPFERTPASKTRFGMKANEKVTFTKMVAVHTTRDSDQPVESCRETLRKAAVSGYSALRSAHEAAWEKAWESCDVVIEGDEVAQRALRFCIYHILIAAPTHEERVSIGAKTLSGFGYKGHVFWDTELFMLPPLTLSEPERAHRLLMYRYHNLQGARNKAAEAGFEGAMFPWESTDTGEETTPRWANEIDQTGQRIRIWTGDNEQHISTDIAYAVMQYWRWTGDDDWFAQYGAEILLDTAKFWGSRAEWNAEKDRYELRMQIGPDEYHENIDNSVFTNRMVVWHLQMAKQAWEWLQTKRPDAAKKLFSTLDLNEERLAKWDDVAAKMWIPHSEQYGGVLEQFEQFFERLHPINLEDYSPRTANMDWILGHHRTQSVRVIKQADVVMLMALLGQELGDHDFLMRNWELYSKVVDHGSSLSPSIHAWVASRLGLIDEAYELFLYSATIDLEDHKGNVHDGIHAACCGGVWQAVLFGFCGLELTDAGPKVNPALPSHWRRVRFKVRYRGRVYPFDIRQEG